MTELTSNWGTFRLLKPVVQLLNDEVSPHYTSAPEPNCKRDVRKHYGPVNRRWRAVILIGFGDGSALSSLSRLNRKREYQNFLVNRKSKGVSEIKAHDERQPPSSLVYHIPAQFKIHFPSFPSINLHNSDHRERIGKDYAVLSSLFKGKSHRVLIMFQTKEGDPRVWPHVVLRPEARLTHVHRWIF